MIEFLDITGRSFPHHWNEKKGPGRGIRSTAGRAAVSLGATGRKAGANSGASSSSPFAERDVCPANARSGGARPGLPAAGEGYGAERNQVDSHAIPACESERGQSNRADMTLDARTGAYSAKIPASFVDPRWDRMYFVEVVDHQGNGRIYPDLELEMPYISRV
jgi:hypothetical protein